MRSLGISLAMSIPSLRIFQSVCGDSTSPANAHEIPIKAIGFVLILIDMSCYETFCMYVFSFISLFVRSYYLFRTENALIS